MRRIPQTKQNQRRRVAAGAALTLERAARVATGSDEGEVFMTLPQSTSTAEPSLGRDVLSSVRYYLGNRWAILGLGNLAAIAGLSFGGWGWLVAAGLAPVILSTLPCLVMCGLGLCLACRSNRAQSTTSGDAADSARSSTVHGVARMEQPTAGSSSCCHGRAAESQSPQIKQLQALNERSNSHA